MSTFSGLHTAASGLSAAQRAMQIAGHNIANVNTDGYTRQRVELTSTGAPTQVGRLSIPSNTAGQGVSIADIARLGNAQLDARMRDSAGVAAQAESIVVGLDRIEQTFNEPGDNGLSAMLADYWNAWDDVASNPGESPAASVLIESAGSVADRLTQMHNDLEDQYGAQHQQLSSRTADVNAAAASLAELNGRIRQADAAGSNTSELLDQRDQLTLQISELTGATVRNQPNGTAEVIIGGTHLVSDTNARSLTVTGSGDLAHNNPPSLAWSHREGASAAANITGGSIASNLSMLAPADESGRGGAIAQTAANLDAIAADLATTVNQAHAQGLTVHGEAGGDFFSFNPDSPAASLSVAVSGADELAVAAPGQGALDGHNASAIAALGDRPDGADAMWSAMVADVGTQLRNAALADVNASTAHYSAVNAQQSHSAVSLDEENISLMQNQHAYQGAARVLTAIDQMLDTLINRTGIVGR